MTTRDKDSSSSNSLSPTQAPLKELLVNAELRARDIETQRSRLRDAQISSDGWAPCIRELIAVASALSPSKCQGDCVLREPDCRPDCTGSPHPPTSRAPESIRLALDALESDATDAMREEAFNKLRDDFYPIDGPPFGSPHPPTSERVEAVLLNMETFATMKPTPQQARQKTAREMVELFAQDLRAALGSPHQLSEERQ